jgi:pimeloyl-ACP methyl ester carboxylesterase
MPYITTKDGTQLFYKDWGQGQPIVFHHGWATGTLRCCFSCSAAIG